MQFESPQHWNYNKLSGIALCAVVSFQNCQEQTRTEQEQTNYLSAKFTCKGMTGEEPCTQVTWKVGSWSEQDAIGSDHVFTGYTSCAPLIKHLEDKHSSQCAPVVALLEFSVTNENTSGEARFEVLKSGLSFVFEPDENRKNPFQDANSVACPMDTDISEVTSVTEILRTICCLMDQANGLGNHQKANGKTK